MKPRYSKENIGMVVFLAIRFLEAVWQNISNILQELILTSQFGSYFRQLQEVFRNPLISDGNGLLLDGGRLSTGPGIFPRCHACSICWNGRIRFSTAGNLSASSDTECRLSTPRELRPLWIFWDVYGRFRVCWSVQNPFNLIRFYSLSLRLLSYDIF